MESSVSASLSSYSSHAPRRPLSREAERRLACRARAGEDEAIQRLVGAHIGSVVRIARRYRHRGIPLEDLVEEGVIGLLEAVQRFDPSHDNKFLTYAVWWIRRSIVRYLSEGASLVRVPRYRSRQFKNARREASRLATRMGRQPRSQELARELGCSPQEAARRLRSYPRPVSLDQPPPGWDRPLAQVFEDTTWRDQEERLLHQEDLDRLRSALESLPDREHFVLRHRFGLEGREPRTLRDLAEEMGISKERVRQLEVQARGRLERRMKR